MGNTATINHANATITRFVLGEDGRAVIAGQETGRTQDYTHNALQAAVRCCPEGGEGQSLYGERALSVAALDEAQRPEAKSTAPAPGLAPGMAT